MTEILYTLTVPAFNTMLGALLPIFAKAKAYAIEKKFDESVLISGRLAPDMFALARQVQIAADFARGVSARLAGVAVPTSEGQEKSFADLDAMLTQTLVFLDSLQAAQFDGSESREIVLRPGTPKEKKLSGHTYLEIGRAHV